MGKTSSHLDLIVFYVKKTCYYSDCFLLLRMFHELIDKNFHFHVSLHFILDLYQGISLGLKVNDIPLKEMLERFWKT